MRRFVMVVMVCLLAMVARGQAVPQIPFDSVPNFLKLPPDMHLGEAWERRAPDVRG